LPQPTNTPRYSDHTFLFQLRDVCAHPRLGSDATDLSKAVEAFAAWLETKFATKGVNLGTLGTVDITISRYRYLRMCGDIAKHNPARLEDNVKHLRRLLQNAGRPVSEDEAYLALDDFFTWYYDDILIVHSSSIAAFLNNIRWEIYEYLGAEYPRSWHHQPGLPAYFHGYRYPGGCDAPVARAMYWDLMNRVRKTPYLQPFTVAPSLASLY
jgi:hypothetical protein